MSDTACDLMLGLKTFEPMLLQFQLLLQYMDSPCAGAKELNTLCTFALDVADSCDLQIELLPDTVYSLCEIKRFMLGLNQQADDALFGGALPEEFFDQQSTRLAEIILSHFETNTLLVDILAVDADRVLS